MIQAAYRDTLLKNINKQKIYIAIIYIGVILFCIDRERGSMGRNRTRIFIILGEIAVILVLVLVIFVPKSSRTSTEVSTNGKVKASADTKETGKTLPVTKTGETAAAGGSVYGDEAIFGDGTQALNDGGSTGENDGSYPGTDGSNPGNSGSSSNNGTGSGSGSSSFDTGLGTERLDEGLTSEHVTVNPEQGRNLNVTSSDPIEKAAVMAAMYDYDGAIETLKAIPKYETREDLKTTVKQYETERDKLVKWEDNTKISHLFVHSLIVDTSRAFRKGSSQPVGYNRYMTTVGEFKAMLESLYEREYVLVSMHDIAERYVDTDGAEKLRKKAIYLPEGKKPFVLSQDDVNYYAYMDNDGFADRLVIGDDGRPTCQYTDTDGNVSYGEYDVLPIVDNFLLEHPDFSYRGAKGILAVTGYEGALGYDTGWHMYDLDNPDEAAKLKAEQEKVKKVAEAIKADGWEFASHSYTHTDMKKNSFDKVVYDTDKWEREVEPLLGETDLYIYPFGSDICDWKGYKGDKYEYLKKAGFWYFCNVDASQYWIQITDNYMRMGRINADGERMMKTPQKLDYFFDSAEVIDKTRPKLE